MDEAAIYAKLQDIFREVFDDDTIVLRPELTADDIEAWDSFHHVNIIVACEVAFGISFKAAELEELHRVGDLVEAIHRKLN